MKQGPETRRNIQLNYVVAVRSGKTVETDPKEHSDWRWVKEGDVEMLNMTPEMKRVVYNAFQFASK